MVSIQNMSTFATSAPLMMLLLVSRTTQEVSGLLNKVPLLPPNHAPIKQWWGHTIAITGISTATTNSNSSTRPPCGKRDIHPVNKSFSSSRFYTQFYQQKSSTTITMSTTHLEDNNETNLDNISSSTRNMQHVLNTAEIAAYQAGEIMRATFGKISISHTKMNDRDLVTESDVECQRLIKEIIRSKFPQDEFLGEEDVSLDAVAGDGNLASSNALKNSMENLLVDDGIRESSNDNEEEKIVPKNHAEKKLLWIVDPIDGTTNFQAGLCMFCVSIGVVSLEKKNDNEYEPVVVAGVIYNPILNELVSAVRGKGCYVNGQRLLQRKKDTIYSNEDNGRNSLLKSALINVGFPVASDSALNASSKAVAALATKVRGIRMIASASQVMSWVAQGKLNAYISWDLNSWDVAAGMVIVEEAGGYVSNFDGSRADISSRDLIVTCSENNNSHGVQVLNGAIRKILMEHDCLKY